MGVLVLTSAVELALPAELNEQGNGGAEMEVGTIQKLFFGFEC